MFAALLLTLAQTPEPLRNANGPFEPAEAVKHLFVPHGFKVTSVAHEPAIVDPVCLCFDARGRIFVCEMPGYPNGGRALGEETRGKIKMLEDKDGDGYFETATLFADGLRFPTGITPYKDGMIVCNAPDIIYLKDTNGDGKADVKEIWYTGFDLANIQQLPNSLQWGPDNRIWGMVAGTGGTITCPKKPDMKPVNLRGKAFRFDPATPGSFEPTSGGGQYGLCRDAAGTWFTCSNGNCVRQIVLPEELVSRNRDYVPPAVTADIDVEGTSIKVFRKSPFEAWRVERTTRRREGDDNKKYIQTELVPGGFTSSTCGCIVASGFFPAISSLHYFVACDPGNNLIFRRALTRQPKSLLYQTSRPKEDRDSELLSSDDNWFRPVSLYYGPDHAIYICDFYREVIETPLSIPDDMKKRLNVESRSRGRIWRLSHSEYQPAKLKNWNDANETELQDLSNDRNSYNRTLSNRLRSERFNWQPPTRTESQMISGPRSIVSEFRTLIASPLSAPLIAKRTIQRGWCDDPWFQDALLCGMQHDDILPLIGQSKINPSFQAKLIVMLGRKNQPKDIASVLNLLAEETIKPAALSSLGRGMQSKGSSLAKLLADPPPECKEAVEKLRIRFAEAAQKSDESSLRLLAFAPFDLAKPAFVRTFTLDTPSAIQQEAVRSLGQHADPSIPELLLERWNGFSPAVRKEVQDVLLSKPERTLALLAALEKGRVKAGELDPARVQQLRNHPNANVRTKATAILASSIPADRQKVLADYAGVIDLKGDIVKGKAIFQNQCATCHKLDGIGNDVGPNLLATLTGKSTRDLMTAILDPNREVDTRFLSYTATLNDGRVLTGIVASESANGLTLRQADGKEDSILRADLESLKSSGQSLMPEGLEKQIDKQALADLIAFLKQNRN